jgi:hypothetical protein|tara:strand:- start:3269 stop:3457 length:189 start_codon:yes stop_codon:yes gene_type:complete
MATNKHTIEFRAPALPYPPEEYNAFQFEEFNKVLRLYFNQIDNALRDKSLARQSEAMGWFIS